MPLDVAERSEPGALELSREVGRGTAFFMVTDRSFVGAGFRNHVLSFDRPCAAPALRFTPEAGWSFAGVPFFDTRASCEAIGCAEDACGRFEYGECAEAVATSAARVRSVHAAPEAARLRTFDRFRRIDRRGRLWRRGTSGCVLVEASRDEWELELRYSDDVEGARFETTERYVISPLDSNAALLSSSTLFSATGGGVGSFGAPLVSLAFGDGVVLLGNDDYFFTRRDCEASVLR